MFQWTKPFLSASTNSRYMLEQPVALSCPFQVFLLIRLLPHQHSPLKDRIMRGIHLMFIAPGNENLCTMRYLYGDLNWQYFCWICGDFSSWYISYTQWLKSLTVVAFLWCLIESPTKIYKKLFFMRFSCYGELAEICSLSRNEMWYAWICWTDLF